MVERQRKIDEHFCKYNPGHAQALMH
jgi:hypothetical protein